MDEPAEVGVGGLLAAFVALVQYLDARGTINAAEFADILKRGRGRVSPQLSTELENLAAFLALSDLRVIQGGKTDDTSEPTSDS